MLMDDALKEYLFECEVRRYTWKTIKGYRNGLEFLVNYLKQEQQINKIEEITSRNLKALFMSGLPLYPNTSIFSIKAFYGLLTRACHA